MKILKSGLAMVLMASVCVANATSYSPVSKIKSLTLGTEYVRIKLDNMGSMEANEQCGASATATSHGNFVLDITNGSSEAMFSTLLAAKAMKEKLFFQLAGCHEGYPKINHIYLCDEMWCP